MIEKNISKNPVQKEITRSARDEAMRYLEYRAHTASEVQSHLKGKGFPEEEIDECMEFLSDCHFIDDEAYCRRYIEYSIEKGRGPQRIRQELSQKGISGELIAIGMDGLYDSETQRETALRQAEKALGISTTSKQHGNAYSGLDGNGPSGLFGQGEYADYEECAEEPGEEREAFTEKELAKAARRLAGLGFSQSIVYDVLNRLRRS